MMNKSKKIIIETMDGQFRVVDSYWSESDTYTIQFTNQEIEKNIYNILFGQIIYFLVNNNISTTDLKSITFEDYNNE